MAELRAVIFDFNGVLLDDEHLHWRAYAEVLAPEGIELGQELYFERYLGHDDRGVLGAVHRDLAGGEARPSWVERTLERKAARYRQLLEQDLRMFDGGVRLARALFHHVPLAIASGALRSEIEYVLGKTGLARCFPIVVSADEIPRGKPDPAGYLAALRELRRTSPSLRDLWAEECLVIEDSPPGVEAAHRAGMRCLGVTSYRTRAELAHADAVVETLDGLGVEDARRFHAGG